jgi:hydrogenase-4 component F
MILIAYILSTTLAIAIIAFSHTNLRMNAVSVAHGLVFGAVTLAALLTSPIPINSFIVGSQYFYIDHLAIYEVLITIVIFTLSAVYAGGYVESLIATGELEKGSLRLFYGAWSLLLLIVVLAFCSDNLALFWIFAEMTTIVSAMLIAVLSANENIDAAIKYIFIASTAMLFSFVGFVFLFEASREKLV